MTQQNYPQLISNFHSSYHSQKYFDSHIYAAARRKKIIELGMPYSRKLDKDDKNLRNRRTRNPKSKKKKTIFSFHILQFFQSYNFEREKKFLESLGFSTFASNETKTSIFTAIKKCRCVLCYKIEIQ